MIDYRLRLPAKLGSPVWCIMKDKESLIGYSLWQGIFDSVVIDGRYYTSYRIRFAEEEDLVSFLVNEDKDVQNIFFDYEAAVKEYYLRFYDLAIGARGYTLIKGVPRLVVIDDFCIDHSDAFCYVHFDDQPNTFKTVVISARDLKNEKVALINEMLDRNALSRKDLKEIYKKVKRKIKEIDNEN